jgi:hypothetical protein
MSAIERLEQRVAALESEVATLKEKRRFNETQPSGHAWLNKIYGAFANDPEYLEAMRLGKQFRDEVTSQPKAIKKRKRSHADS